MFSKSIFTALFFVVSLLVAACTPIQQAGQQVELQFVTHPMASMPEQDVYILGENEGEVVRVQLEETDQYLDAPVYATTERIEHDPLVLGENPFGPYERGMELGFTMGEWLAGTGTGVYKVVGDKAELELELSSLVPNGVYTIWCARMNLPPNFEIIDLPCGAADGSENVVSADGDGALSYSVSMDALEPTTEDSLNVIAAAYHSDGNTFGSYPGNFGFDTHVQILSVIPAPGDAAWQTIESNVVASR
ncbi:hypothetical protein KFU94_01375 [Chloroflexi bacterium TSY]|nr:hypothetical protein [Chloroflexi bacterium TSY]